VEGKKDQAIEKRGKYKEKREEDMKEEGGRK
jgi:hypothetical protein